MDLRNAKSQAQRQADEAAAQGLMHPKKEEKGWMGGLDSYAKHIQEGAWNKDKNKDLIAEEQLKQAKDQTDLLKRILNKPAPVLT